MSALYFSVLYYSVLFSFLLLPLSCLPCLVLGFQMLTFSLPYIGFVDGVSRSNQNLTSAAWAIYAPTDELISLHSIFLGCATNNIAQYSAIIELLTDAISFGIHHLIVHLDLQLVVQQLSNIYSIRSPTLLQVYLRIHLLESHFDYIEYQHIPRYLNTLTDALANYVLDRHLHHL
jgi:ribonuclease HI